jgi:copper resistance protein B
MTAFAATLFAGAAALPATAWAQDHAHHAEQDKKEEKAGEQERPAPTPSDAPVLPGLQFGPDGQLTVGEADTVIPLDETPPPAAFEGPRHAADEIYGEAAMAPARAQLADENGNMTTGMVMLERLEYRGGAHETYLWDAQAWYGGDIDKLWLKSEGEGEFGDALEDADVQALWSRAIGPWFDFQAGVRYTIEPTSRAHLALGVQGLAPYMFHVDAAAFLSTEGDLTALIEAEFDQKITQRLILQPRVEMEFSAQDVPEFDLGSGITKIEAGARLRYEIAREFAPYVGVGWERKLGRTANIARAEGEGTGGFVAVAGLRAWF